MIWNEHLPQQYLDQALEPVSFERFEEPEAMAVKCMGYDNLRQCCFYRHQFSLTRAVMDEDESFHEEETYFEEVRAWRLENGKWLRRTITGGEAGDCRSRLLNPVYEIVPERPR
ncbi:MAG: hypothetical protein K2P57_07360 [Burkholderiales bacterium]|nr:hypothetical protein [Burkholderiales bacterium]